MLRNIPGLTEGGTVNLSVVRDSNGQNYRGGIGIMGKCRTIPAACRIAEATGRGSRKK